MNRIAMTAAVLAVTGLTWTASAQQTPANQPEAQPAPQQRVDEPADRIENRNNARTTVQQPQQGQTPMLADRVVDADRPEGATAENAEGVRDALSVTSHEVMEKDFAGLVQLFVDADRNRFDDYDDEQASVQKLYGRIEQIQKAWQAKYGEEFDIDDEDAVFSQPFAMIQTGEFGDDAQLARIVLQNSKVATGQRLPTPEGADNDAGDQNIEADREIAVATIADSDMVKGLTVPFIREFPGVWKINIPDHLTGEQLTQNLLNHLTHVGENVDKWPGDKQQAYRLVTVHVLKAVLDQPVQSDQQNPQQQPMQNQPAQRQDMN